MFENVVIFFLSPNEQKEELNWPTQVTQDFIDFDPEWPH